MVVSETIPVRNAAGVVTIEQEQYHLRIAYTYAHTKRRTAESTRMELRFHREANAMWIDTLHVAKPYRLAGLGGALVRVAERIAAILGADTVHVFPLKDSGLFWQKMGYGRHRVTARVLSKPVEWARAEANAAA